jgi:EAL domain-containing protein (putative c-di-GMP-specific phosphodiesterase class I)
VQTALQSSSFGLLFQATLCFKNDDLKHFEIRSQFRDEEGSKLPSELVFESAIQNALGEQLDRRVILEALKTLGLTRNQQLRFTINLTQNSIVSADFFPWLESVLKNYPALSGQLVFQLSEIDILIAQHHMEYFCQMLSQLDIRLSISNFGCTLDPFRYLSLLRAHYVKLDVSLLKKLGREHIRQQNLISLVSEIQDNGLQVIAPLIERSSFLPLLWQAGIEFAQGNVIHKPEQKLNLQLLEHEEITIQ